MSNEHSPLNLLSHNRSQRPHVPVPGRDVFNVVSTDTLCNRRKRLRRRREPRDEREHKHSKRTLFISWAEFAPRPQTTRYCLRFPLHYPRDKMGESAISGPRIEWFGNKASHKPRPRAPLASASASCCSYISFILGDICHDSSVGPCQVPPLFAHTDATCTFLLASKIECEFSIFFPGLVLYLNRDKSQ